jgi:hypothetical protein
MFEELTFIADDVRVRCKSSLENGQGVEKGGLGLSVAVVQDEDRLPEDGSREKLEFQIARRNVVLDIVRTGSVAPRHNEYKQIAVPNPLKASIDNRVGGERGSTLSLLSPNMLVRPDLDWQRGACFEDAQAQRQFSQPQPQIVLERGRKEDERFTHHGTNMNHTNAEASAWRQFKRRSSGPGRARPDDL